MSTTNRTTVPAPSIGMRESIHSTYCYSKKNTDTVYGISIGKKFQESYNFRDIRFIHFESVQYKIYNQVSLI